MKKGQKMRFSLIDILAFFFYTVCMLNLVCWGGLHVNCLHVMQWSAVAVGSFKGLTVRGWVCVVVKKSIQ